LSTLDAIARIIEEQNPGYKCSILLVAEGRFVSGAGPSLPNDYNSAIDGYAVGPNVGSCGTAIFWNVPVIVEDIQADPLWVPFAELAKKAGVAACWSHPFVSRGGQVLGALALYASEPCAPTTAQLSQLKAAARMTGLAVERGRAEEELRERRKRELELEAQLQQAAKMESLGVLAGGVAHDFNNQLQPILGYTDLLKDELKDGKQLDYVESILQAVEHSTRLVSDLLIFSRKGQLTESTPIDIHKTLAEVAALLKHSIKKNVEVHQHLNASQSITEGDPTQMQNMILNIALNADDAMPDGGDLVFRTDIVELQDTAMMAFNPPAGSYIHIQISDTGTGMDEETRQRIFEPFFTTKEAGKGTGMGLASVYGAVEKQKGTITMESTVGKGTTFSIYLPLSGASILTGVSAKSREAERGTGRILLVDDDRAIRRFAEIALDNLGYDVTTATNGKEAVSIFEKDWQEIDAVLLDISMPEMDGPAAFYAMRKINPEVKVILCTGYDTTSKAQKFLAEGVKAFLEKPYARAEMAEKLAHVLSAG
jgi:signal transduction histidine kinase/ActR/RegA family two-component response regulator